LTVDWKAARRQDTNLLLYENPVAGLPAIGARGGGPGVDDEEL